MSRRSSSNFGVPNNLVAGRTLSLKLRSEENICCEPILLPLPEWPGPVFIKKKGGMSVTMGERENHDVEARKSVGSKRRFNIPTGLKKKGGHSPSKKKKKAVWG